MTAELNKLANDPNFVVEFAVGDPFPDLVEQDRSSGLHLSHIYFDEPKRYLLKSAKFSRDDMRVFDVDTGHVVLVSHHPGKNPYEIVDPLGTLDSAFDGGVGEWESVSNVSGMCGFDSFKVRPKWMSRHGRQYVRRLDGSDDVALNVGRLSKLKTWSMRNQFGASEGEDGDMVYKIVADMLGRSLGIYNEDEQLVAQVAKTKKALILNAVFGAGSESTIDIAPGVDCSAMLAVIFAMWQVGKHCRLCTFFALDCATAAGLQLLGVQHCLSFIASNCGRESLVQKPLLAPSLCFLACVQIARSGEFSAHLISLSLSLSHFHLHMLTGL